MKDQSKCFIRSNDGYEEIKIESHGDGDRYHMPTAAGQPMKRMQASVSGISAGNRAPYPRHTFCHRHNNDFKNAREKTTARGR